MTRIVYRGVLYGTTWQGYGAELEVHFESDHRLDVHELHARLHQIASDFQPPVNFDLEERYEVRTESEHGPELPTGIETWTEDTHVVCRQLTGAV
jgi:hypothetical protein